MTTWASLAAAPAPAAPVPAVTILKDKRLAVVDANAIISMGANIRSLGDVLYTTEEVLAEIRDAKSRQVLEQVEIVTGHPSSDSVKAVSNFAKLTGDSHQLSRIDIHLLALAHTLEVEAHGSKHLRTEPVQIRRTSKLAPRGRLPGWGNNGQSDEWDAIDAYEDDDMEQAIDEQTEATDDAGTSGAGGSVEDEYSGHDDEDEPGDMGDDSGWEVAKRSSNAARRASRKAMRIAAREMLATVGEAEDLADDEEPPTGASEEEEEPDSDARADPEALKPEAAFDRGDATPSGTAAPSEDFQTFQSNICLVTADFPMQNVCLQMGLRLVTKSGLRITSLQRFVLRCDGCATVCQDTSKLFCPACGHPTLSRVEVHVGPDGADIYGVRKKHVLKGTRYSLPKPVGGRNQATPILSEDVYKAKVRKPKAKASEDDPFENTTFGDLKAFQNQPDHITKGLSHLTSNFRNNPNERKSTMRSNRRKR